MRSAIGAYGLVAAGCGVALFGGSAFAAVVDGAHYTGTTSVGTKVDFRVAPSGKQLATYNFRALTTCANGENGTVFFRTAHDGPLIRIHANGFSLVSKVSATIFDRRANKHLQGTYTDSVRGRFGQKGTATGKLRIRFNSRDGQMRCDTGKLHYTAQAA